MLYTSEPLRGLSKLAIWDHFVSKHSKTSAKYCSRVKKYKTLTRITYKTINNLGLDEWPNGFITCPEIGTVWIKVGPIPTAEKPISCPFWLDEEDL